MSSRKSWVDYTLAQRKKYLEDNSDKADCEFLVCPENSKTPKVLKSFKWILSDVSPVFCKLFKENNGKQVRIEDYSAADFESFLRYIHNYEPTEQSLHTLLVAYVIGKKYKLYIDDVKREMSREFSEKWDLSWLVLFEVAYSKEDADLQSLFEALQLNRKLKVSSHEDYMKFIANMSLKVFVRLLKLLISHREAYPATIVFEKYLESNWKNLSNLDKDTLRGIANDMKISVALIAFAQNVEFKYLDVLLDNQLSQ